MKPVALLLACSACGAGKTGSTEAPTTAVERTRGAAAAVEDVYQPLHDKDDLRHALLAERAAVAAAEQRVQKLEDSGDHDQLRSARADLAVRHNFVASLESCEAARRACPPRLDDPAWTFDIERDVDPKLDTPLRFDVASWQKVSAELHGRACVCRTLACVESMFVAIERLETRPMPDVQADEAASLSITRARECLYRLRGLRPTPRAIAVE